MEIISSGNYRAFMEETVAGYLQERLSCGFFETAPGIKLYYEVSRADEPKADVVMLHGYSEAIAKYRECVYYFLQMGCNVWQLQMREHGRSHRSTNDLGLIHIEDYRDMIRDVRHFVKKIVKKEAEHPLHLYGHSMGGGIGACYLEKFLEDFQKAVLSSPMLQLNIGKLPVLAARAAAKVMVESGKGSFYMPGAKPFDENQDFLSSNSTCKARYDYWFAQQKEHPEYQMCITSYATALELLHITECALARGNTEKVRADVLLFQAGKDALVRPYGQEEFIRRIEPHGRILVFPAAKHEIYLSDDETLREYWKAIKAFFV